MGILALTSGDPSGIGPEIAIEAWRRRSQDQTPPFLLLSDPALVEARAGRMGLPVKIATVTPEEAGAAFADALPIVPLEASFLDSPGNPNAVNAAGTIEAIETAVRLVVSGRADALVTCPIAKKPLYDAGFGYPGHTEFLGHLAETIARAPATPVMMLAGPELRAVPVTIHIPLAKVAPTLTTAVLRSTAWQAQT